MNTLTPTVHELLSRASPPSVKEILSTSDLLNAIRSESSELIGFLTPESLDDPDIELKAERISDLTTWALTDRNNECALDYRVCRNACNMLSAPTSLLQKRVSYEGSPFIEIMRTFIGTKYAKKSEYAGHYMRIFEAAMRTSEGEFLKQMDNCSAHDKKISNLFYIKILKKVNISGFNQLFVLLTSNASYLNILVDGNTQLFVKNVLKVLKSIIKKSKTQKDKESKNDFWICCVFRALNDVFSKNPDLIEHFKIKKLLKKLMSMVLKLKDKSIVTISNAFNLLKKIKSGLDPSYFEDFLQKYSSKLQIKSNSFLKPDFIKENAKLLDFYIYAFEVFGEKLIFQSYPLFFMESSINDNFCISFLNVIKNMNDETKRHFLTFNDDIILKKIIESISPPPINDNNTEGSDSNSIITQGNILALAQYIANPEENKVTTPFMETPMWLEFVTKKLLVYELIFKGIIPMK